LRSPGRWCWPMTMPSYTSVPGSIKRKPRSPALRMEKAVAVLNDAIRDLRRNLGELRAASTEESLPDALHRMANDPRFRSLVDISLELDLPDSASLAPVRTDHVLAIVGEALSNVIRHARAQRVRIIARRADHRLRMTIQDNGVGFACDDHDGYGLRNMRDRARLLGGQLEVTSASGQGTTLTLDIPWSDQR